MKTEESHADFMRRMRASSEESNRKYGGPPPPLTEDELDASATELHNFLRRGQPAKSAAEDE
jgi:hypothetical protein